VSHRSTASLRAGIAIEVDAMVERIEELEAEVAHLRKENASLWETVHEAQDAVVELRAMNERAREDA
jgi:FtsZ-binding cell division protein ZapB